MAENRNLEFNQGLSSTEKEKWLRKGRNIALYRLNRRDFASSELSDYLAKRDVPSDIIPIVIDSLTQMKLLDDEKFARNKCLALVRRGKGFAWIKRDLLSRGIEIQVGQYQEWVNEAGEASELEIARGLVERKYPEAFIDRKVLHKAYQTLLRRGFSFAIAREATSSKKKSRDL